MTTTHERLEEVFRRVFRDEALAIEDATNITRVPGWDSVTQLNLMFSIEDEFGVHFSGNQLADLRYVAEIKRFLDRAA